MAAPCPFSHSLTLNLGQVVLRARVKSPSHKAPCKPAANSLLSPWQTPAAGMREWLARCYTGGQLPCVRDSGWKPMMVFNPSAHTRGQCCGAGRCLWMLQSWMCIKHSARTTVTREIATGFVHAISLENCTGKQGKLPSYQLSMRVYLKQMDLPVPGLHH